MAQRIAKIEHFSGRATGASLKQLYVVAVRNAEAHFSGRATGASLKPVLNYQATDEGIISPVARLEPH